MRNVMDGIIQGIPGEFEEFAVEIDFYTNAMSRGRIAHWMMEEFGEPYRTHWVEYGEQMKSPEYLRINPMGKVPALVCDGAVVTECAAIVGFLASVRPEKSLIPSGAPALADFWRWLCFAAGPVEQAIMVKSMGWSASAKQQATLGFGCLEDTVNALETAFGKGPWICGDQFTAADVYVGSQLGWGMQFGTLEQRPRFEEYVARCQAREAWQRAEAINAERLAETRRD